MENREKHLLWLILYRTISRYILINMPGREYWERADLHFFISKMLCHYILMDGGIWTIRGLDDECPKGWIEIHDWIADNITDRMDETIGFVIDRQMSREEQDKCIRIFFDLLCKNIDVMAKIIADSNSESVNIHNG